MTDQNHVPCGIATPQIFNDGPVEMDLVDRYVRQAETLGYDSLWVQDQTLGTAPSLEPVSLLCYVAAITRRVRLGTSVLVAPHRNPVNLAKTLITLDQMSNGRLIIGIGLGGPSSRAALFAAPSERRVRHFVEGLNVMKALMEQPRATYKGRSWNLEEEPMEPKGVQKPRPPIWFGARHPDALRRAVRHGDGWMGAGSSTPQDFKEQVGIVRGALDEAGRDRGSFAISKRVYVAIDDDRPRAERRLRDWFGAYYGNADMASRVAFWGSESQVAEGLAGIVDSGAQMLMLNPVFDLMEHVETLAQKVVPQLPRR